MIPHIKNVNLTFLIMRNDSESDGRGRRNIVGKLVVVVGLKFWILDGPTGYVHINLQHNSLINNTYSMDESTRARESCRASEPNDPISSSTHTVGLSS